MSVDVSDLCRKKSGRFQRFFHTEKRALSLGRSAGRMKSVVTVAVPRNTAICFLSHSVFFTLQHEKPRAFAQVEPFAVGIKRGAEIMRQYVERVKSVDGKFGKTVRTADD